MMLDVFKGDAFNMTALTAAILKIPYVPTRLGDMGIFDEEGVSTTSIAIELQNGVLTLVPSAPRGSPGPAKYEQPRQVKNFTPVHLPQRVGLMADEVQNLRAFGKETDEELAMSRLAKKLAIAKRDLTITHEWQRIGCLKGQVIDADGTTVLVNYFTEFGVTQQTKSIALSNSATKVLQETTAIKRLIEDKLGGLVFTGIEVLCSPEFFDALTSHPAVTESYRYQSSQVLRDDLRDGFVYNRNMVFREYRGQVGAQRFIAANKAYAIPIGVPDLFKSYFAPAPYMETVNTVGLPFYAKQKSLDYDTGVEVQVQSNPLHICTRPEVVVELTAT